MYLYGGMKRTASILAFLAIAAIAQATGKFDRTVHNFGDVLLSDGALSCTFTVRNDSAKPMAIYSVVSSCGCTAVEWTKQPIMPGKSGTVKATYKNDEGPYPFDKTLTVYLSDEEKPVILHIRGIVHEKEKSLEEMYPVRIGPLGFKETDIKGGNFEQGRQISDEIQVANLSGKPLKLEFKDVSPELALKLSQNPIPAKGTAKISYTVTASREKWGKSYCWFTPVADGKAGRKIGIWTITKENFSSWTKEQKDNASRPMFETSTFTFGKVKAGKRIDATFKMTNKGKSTFKVYKADSETAGVTPGVFPDVAPGGSCSWKVSLDTTGMPSGEVLAIISLITNSPSRPLVNLFITGWIE